MCTHKRAEEIRRGREPGQFKIGKNNVEPRFHYPPGYCTHTVHRIDFYNSPKSNTDESGIFIAVCCLVG